MFIEELILKDGEYIEDSIVNIISISGVSVNSVSKVGNSISFSNGCIMRLTF